MSKIILPREPIGIARDVDEETGLVLVELGSNTTVRAVEGTEEGTVTVVGSEVYLNG